jgi:hypothetical protein
MSEIVTMLVIAGWGVGLLVIGGIVFDVSRRREREREAQEREDARNDGATS